MKNKLLDIINGFSHSTLKQIEEIPNTHLTRILAAQLNSQIDSHGPIHKVHVGSASKRIANNIKDII